MEIMANITQNLQLRGSMTHFTEKPDSSFRESKNIASLIINFHKEKWNYNLSGYFHDEKQFESRTSPELLELDSFIVVNTKLQYTVFYDTIVFGAIHNLFYEEYFTPPGNDTNPTGIPNQGRTIIIGVTQSF